MDVALRLGVSYYFTPQKVYPFLVGGFLQEATHLKYKQEEESPYSLLLPQIF